MFGDKCVLSDSDTSDAEYPMCGLTFLEDDSGKPCVVMAVNLGFFNRLSRNILTVSLYYTSVKIIS